MLKPRHILAVFPGFGVGGAQARYAALANAFGDAAQHSLIALNGALGCREKLAAGLHIRFVAAQRHAGMASAVAAAMATIRSIAPNVVLTSNWGAIEWAIAAKLTGTPHVHSEDGFGPEERSRQVARRVWTRRVALRASKIVLPSQTLMRIAGQVWRLPAKNLHFVPNGIDLARFADGAPALMAGVTGPVIGTIAALRAEKNIFRLLAAFAAVPASFGATLVIVGDGPERAGLQAEAARLGLAARVIFAGHSVTPERWHAAFDVLVISSDTEQMPLAVLEAMAAGKPVVATDVGDVRAMLAAENAEFVTPLEAGALAGAISTLLENPVLARAIGAANRARAGQYYDERTMVAAWAGLLGVGLAG